MKRQRAFFGKNLSATTNGRPAVSMWITTIIAAIAATTACSLLAAPPVYSQRDTNGQAIFSDAPLVDGQIIRTSYQADYGRPVAKASCLGLSVEKMAARAKAFDQTIEAAANTHNLDADLIRAVAQIESCFDANAVSKVGAQGVMQLMPTTAAELGVSDSFNAVQNIHGGASYLAKMMKRFNRNHQFALAAYNAGPGAVDKHNGIPPYPETQNYVKKVLELYTQKP